MLVSVWKGDNHRENLMNQSPRETMELEASLEAVIESWSGSFERNIHSVAQTIVEQYDLAFGSGLPLAALSRDVSLESEFP